MTLDNEANLANYVKNHEIVEALYEQSNRGTIRYEGITDCTKQPIFIYHTLGNNKSYAVGWVKMDINPVRMATNQKSHDYKMTFRQE